MKTGPAWIFSGAALLIAGAAFEADGLGTLGGLILVLMFFFGSDD